MISDGTYRHHLGDEDLNRMCNLGTFSEHIVVNEGSLVKVDTGVNLRAAALVSCGLVDGLRRGGRPRPGASRRGVIVVGCGGVGSGAIQGARIAGASAIIAVDVLPSKVERAKKIGATHGAANLLEATFLAAELTRGQARRRRHPHARRRSPATSSCRPARLRARAAGSSRSRSRPYDQTEVSLDLFTFAMYNQTLMGTVFGSQSPRVQIPRILDLYNKGTFLIDELVTKEYSARRGPAGLRRPRGRQERPRRRQVRLIGGAADDAGRSRGTSAPRRRARDRTREHARAVGEVVGDAERRERERRGVGRPARHQRTAVAATASVATGRRSGEHRRGRDDEHRPVGAERAACEPGGGERGAARGELARGGLAAAADRDALELARERRRGPAEQPGGGARAPARARGRACRARAGPRAAAPRRRRGAPRAARRTARRRSAGATQPRHVARAACVTTTDGS